MGRFAVCIPVYNGADFIGEALASIARQTLKDVEVIVSDNASTDATADIVQHWSGKMNMRVVRQATTLPMQQHFNAVLDMIDSEFYMLLCHDDYLAHPDALRLAHEVMMDNPGIGTVYCDLQYVNAKRRKIAGRSFRRAGEFDADETGLTTIRSTRNLFGIPLGIRHTALGALRYDPAFHYTMDVDLSWAIAKSSQVFHIAQPLIANRYGATNSTWSLLSAARDEFIALAAKYDVRMNRLDRIRLGMTNFKVTQQKRLFAAYLRGITWLR